MIIQFYFQCAQMTTNNMSTSDGLNIGYKHLYKSRTTLINNRKNKTKRKIFSKLTINTTKWRHWYYIRSFRPKLGQNENKIAPNESLFYKPLTPLIFYKGLPGTQWNFKTKSSKRILRKDMLHFGLTFVQDCSLFGD